MDEVEEVMRVSYSRGGIGGVWHGIDFEELDWRWSERGGLLDAGDLQKLDLGNSKQVSAVVRI